MSDPRDIGELRVFKSLFPGVELRRRTLSSDDFIREHPKHTINLEQDSGAILDGGEAYIWRRLNLNSISELHVWRPNIPLTKREREILHAFEKTNRGLFSDDESRAAQTTIRISTYNGLGNILIARFLRGYSAANFWTPALIVSELQRLCLKTYESSPCTSGVIFASEPREILDAIPSDEFIVEHFKQQVTFEPGFFDSVPTFRYVDGKNAFYLVDNLRNVRGVVRLKNPRNYNQFERTAFRHISKLLELPFGRLFVACAGNNRAVTVQVRNRIQLRWQNAYWSATDFKLAISLIEKYVSSATLAEKVFHCVATVADLRLGTLVLVRSNPKIGPKIAGEIGWGNASASLVELARCKTLVSAIDTNEVLGILGSDGIVQINSDGAIIGAGEILEIEIDSLYKAAGGGRTQAAIYASRFGLAIKVSEDGPISFYTQQKLLITFTR